MVIREVSSATVMPNVSSTRTLHRSRSMSKIAWSVYTRLTQRSPVSG